MRSLMLFMAVLFVLSGANTRVSEAAGKQKIKRIVSRLYDRKTMVQAQRVLPGYGKQVVEYLLPLLDEKDKPSVRAAALRIIGEVGDKGAEDDVIPMMRDREPRVRKAAARALCAIGTEKSLAELRNAMNDYDPNVRYLVLEALARIAPEEDTGIFVAALGDPDPRVRKFAVVGLGRLKKTETVEDISRLAGDPSPEVRFEVAKAMGTIGTRDCLKVLSWQTQDPEPAVRLAALDGIAGIDGNEADEALVQAASRPDPALASRAIRLLGKRGSPKAVVTARKYLDDEHMAIRLACIDVIGSRGSDDDIKLLEPLLAAESTNVRKRARAALETLR